MQTRDIAFVILLMPFTAVPAAGEPGTGLKPDLVQAAAWNEFAARTVALHQKNIQGRKVSTKEEVDRYGGEMGKAHVYREVTYTDADSGRLLGKVRWNAKRADEVQGGEAYVYDERGRVLRDYAFLYLPWARGAPIRTFANIHQYNDGLHAWRQFDASGTRTYEHCEGEQNGQRVSLSIPEERIGSELAQTEEYRACFAGLPRTAGNYLTPQ